MIDHVRLAKVLVTQRGKSLEVSKLRPAEFAHKLSLVQRGEYG